MRVLLFLFFLVEWVQLTPYSKYNFNDNYSQRYNFYKDTYNLLQNMSANSVIDSVYVIV